MWYYIVKEKGHTILNKIKLNYWREFLYLAWEYKLKYGFETSRYTIVNSCNSEIGSESLIKTN